MKIRENIPRPNPLFLEAKNIKEEVLGKKHPDYANACNNLAFCYQDQGLYEKAEALFIEAIDIRAEVLGKNHTDYALSCNNLTGLYERQDKYAQAQPLYFEASQILIENGKSDIARLSEIGKEKYSKTLRNKFEIYNSFVLKAYRQIPVLSAWIYDNSLAFKSQPLAKDTDKTCYTWTDIRQKLQPGEAAIEIIRTEYYDKEWTDSVLYIALIVKPDTKDQPEIVILPNGNELEGRYLAYYRNHIKLSDQLSFEQYWQPIAEKLSGIHKVYLSADGVYHQINLNTLQNPATNKYLIEELEIHQVGSTKDLVKVKKPSTIPQGESLVMGRPKYDLDAQTHQQIAQNPSATRGGGEEDFSTTVEELANVYFRDLVGTEIETQEIFNLFKSKNQKAALYLGANALEEVIKQAQSPKVLHIATHGFFFANNQKKPDEKAPQFSREAEDLDFDVAGLQGFKTTNIQELKSNPMMRSGIVLTGVSTYAKSKDKEKYDTEDGFLSAYEAQNLNLDNTDLVVLSACQTGQGDVQYGEGVYGLQRGFQQAGAKAILMSLWSVDDKATQELMTEFYTQWLSGKTKREAFKLAQEKLKAEYKYPFYWGAFVMVGE
ncbi:MAG: CHAT domain-containing tetratricopeptide repeat protein [Microscillaceae bacterium]|nr:CHAT domain-containing tetratricopeptide repeat protein [Microscillaceae bacterium]